MATAPDVEMTAATTPRDDAGLSPAQKHWGMVRAMVRTPELLTPESSPKESDVNIEEVAPTKGHPPSFIWPRVDRTLGFWENFKRAQYAPVMHPDGALRIKWDIVQALSLGYVSVVVPMRIGFTWPAVGVWFVVWLTRRHHLYPFYAVGAYAERSHVECVQRKQTNSSCFHSCCVQDAP